MSVAQITGNEKAKEIILLSARTQKFGTSYMITGEPGVGKNFAAIQFAKALNCLDPDSSGDCCDVCSNCKLISRVISDLDEEGMQQNPHPDALYINTEKAQIVMDMVLDKLSEINSYRAVKLKKKIVIINDSEKMNTQAANAILKELEEPNDNVIIILLVNNVEKLLPTIISRCHKIELKRAALDEVKKKVKELKPEWDDKKATDAVMFCEGKIGVALEFESFADRIEYVKGLFNVLSSKKDDVEGIFGKVDEIKGFEKNKKSKKALNIRVFLLDILKILSYIYKDIMLAKLSIKDVLREKYGINPDEIRDYSIEKLVNIIKLIETAQRDLMMNANTGLLTSDLFFNIRKEGLK